MMTCLPKAEAFGEDAEITGTQGIVSRFRGRGVRRTVNHFQEYFCNFFQSINAREQ